MSAEILKAGDYVRVAPTPEGPHAGRMGLLVRLDEGVGVVRFSAKRTHKFAVALLRRVTNGVR